MKICLFLVALFGVQTRTVLTDVDEWTSLAAGTTTDFISFNPAQEVIEVSFTQHQTSSNLNFEMFLYLYTDTNSSHIGYVQVKYSVKGEQVQDDYSYVRLYANGSLSYCTDSSVLQGGMAEMITLDVTSENVVTTDNGATTDYSHCGDGYNYYWINLLTGGAITSVKLGLLDYGSYNLAQYLTLSYRKLEKSCTGLPAELVKVKTKATFPVSSGTGLTVSCMDGLILQSEEDVITCQRDTTYTYNTLPTCKPGWNSLAMGTTDFISFDPAKEVIEVSLTQHQTSTKLKFSIFLYLFTDDNVIDYNKGFVQVQYFIYGEDTQDHACFVRLHANDAHKGLVCFDHSVLHDRMADQITLDVTSEKVVTVSIPDNGATSAHSACGEAYSFWRSLVTGVSEAGTITRVKIHIFDHWPDYNFAQYVTLRYRKAEKRYTGQPAEQETVNTSIAVSSSILPGTELSATCNSFYLFLALTLLVL